MKVTRRALARIAAAASAAGVAETQVVAQTPPARAEVRGGNNSGAAQAMAQVKLPRATEPATRFEA